MSSVLRNQATLIRFDARDAYARSRAGTFPPELVINQAGKRVLALSTGEREAVDEEARGAVDAGPAAFLLVFLDIRLVLFAGEAGFELLVVELQVARVPDQVILFQL